MVLAALRGVSFTYAYTNEPALRDINLTLEEGLLYAIIGPNASGKSTLCALLRGIVPLFHEGELTGTAEIRGRNLLEWDPSALSREIGYVFENPFTQISGIKETVFEEIALGLENLGMPPEEVIDRVEQVVEQLELGALVAKNPNELSGGQRQKVAFASIIAMDADVIVIDEPTSQLDPESSDAVFAIIANLKKNGKSIVLVEHKMDLVAQYADRVIALNGGRLVIEGSTSEVFTSPLLNASDIARPAVTDLAEALVNVGRPLARTPVTRAEAAELIRARMKGGPRANRSR
jgi:energy-coupling factor transport system ATP-binding protein